jgi:diguanylate cyclase (GGDEF)-like protein
MATVENTATQQRARLYRVSTLFAGIFVHLMICWTVWSIGHMELSLTRLIAISLLSVAGFLLIGLLIGVEWNLSLVDPDMLVPQMLWALTVVVMTSHFATDLKPVVLFAGLAMVVMGANRLSRPQQLVVAGYGMLLYTGSVLYISNLEGLGWISEIVLMMAFGLVLVFGPALYQFERNNMESVITDKNAELSDALDRIRELAVRDELTGVFNRRHLMEVLAHEKALAARKNYRFSICYLDLDHFKKVNDKFGHAAGDGVLKNFSLLASEMLREVDCIARIGGEEFVLVFSDATQAESTRAAERIGERIRKMPVTEMDPDYRITASMGITEYRQDDSIQKLLERADRALYEAKRTGRNKIVVAGEEASPLGLSTGSSAR